MNNDLKRNLALLGLLVLLGVGGYSLYQYAQTPAPARPPELPTEAKNPPPPSINDTPDPALPNAPADSAASDAVMRRWQEHIKRRGQKRARKQTMKLLQEAMSTSGQARVNYLREAAKLEPENKAVSEMLKAAEKSLAAAKRRNRKKPTGETPPSSPPGPESNPLADPDAEVRPRIIED